MHRPLTISAELGMRILRPSDAADLFLLIHSNRAHLREWLPWVDASCSELNSRDFLRDQWLRAQRCDGASYGIFFQRQLAGLISFHGFDRANRITSLGYWLGLGFCGRGIMRRCVATCTTMAFEQESMNRMVIRCATRNLPSRRIPESLGFKHEGTQRQAEWLYDHFVDLEMYSMLAADWHPPADFVPR